MNSWNLPYPSPVEHRPGIHHYPSLNQHALGSMDKARACASWLIEQGFTVLTIAIGRRNPRIEIQASRRCAALDGAIFTHERTPAGVRRGWVAILGECEVRWSERGAA